MYMQEITTKKCGFGRNKNQKLHLFFFVQMLIPYMRVIIIRLVGFACEDFDINLLCFSVEIDKLWYTLNRKVFFTSKQVKIS